MLEHLHQFEKPSVLEIGIEYGQCAVPLITNLMISGKSFEYVGIDVFLRETFLNMLAYLPKKENQSISPIQMNSLEVLPKLAELNKKFDLILVDGDHNFYTISKELEIIGKHFCNENTIIIVDDYSGKWSARDLYYSEREEYSKVKNTTPVQSTEFVGVRPAVDQFLEANPEWQKVILMEGEPAMLVRQFVTNLPTKQDKNEKLWDW